MPFHFSTLLPTLYTKVPLRLLHPSLIMDVLILPHLDCIWETEVGLFLEHHFRIEVFTTLISTAHHHHSGHALIYYFFHGLQYT